MIRADVMLIGGTGIGSRLAALGLRPTHVPTDHGVMRGFFGEHNGVRLFCVERHSAGHKTPPHLINFRAIASGAKRIGVRAVLSTAAVGSLVPTWGPGTLVACSDFLDCTDRSITMWDRIVHHADFSHGLTAQRFLLEAADALNIPIERSGVYLGADGPRYETPAEIRMFQGFGGHVVGMTASTEAELVGEMGVPYGCLGIVTNLGSGLSPATLDHSEVVDVMMARGATVVEILVEASRRIAAA